MKTRLKRGIAAAAAVLAATTAVTIGAAGDSVAQATGLRAFGITGDGTLMATFTTDQPQVLNWVQTVMGLVGDKSLIGIDFRVQDGLLYGVGNAGGIYTISTPPPNPPVPTPVVAKKVSQLSVPLDGTTFGVDFNPAADRLRVISDNGQNLRHNLANNSTIADPYLTTPPVSGTTGGVTAAAYTNNDLDPGTGTTLFDLNTLTDQVVIQSPANNGTLAPTGALGVDAGLNAGLDIYSDLAGRKTVSNTAFAAVVPSGGSATLFSVNLLTGAAAVMPLGQFPLNITDVAIALDPDPNN
ncbi:DUF4394 domain-containing protein [Amycolatopsis balhimycina DSM 5908]|uniref:DUF4394 domain-containing protein n=1 Tax=Amycolatopsis balhimycina DSM 5908 TaxID=1081091 RepID=A0A428WZZ2_AMYBA|nr:DUF4394 domain-containing protein [Amycolatopsis balhimycina]RSM48648.1 DUF4394 domain-containing protein [Amycolatopsis balhimycina DSM 5908]